MVVMRVETLLPLGKVDPGLRAPETPFEITTIAEQARLVEQLGYDRLVFEETKDDPFVVLAAAAQATTTLGLGTSVAIAFPRSPTSMALAAWSLQRLSGGRFALGLGSQVKGHIERRYGMTWRPPAAWMRDYVHAVRAVWRTWQDGVPLAVDNDHYRLDLMVPLFDAGPIDHPRHPGAAGCRQPDDVLGGRRGGRRHPATSGVHAGVHRRGHVAGRAQGRRARAGRSLERFTVNMKPLIATAPDEQRLAQKVRDARARIAFYASTPSYRAAFAHVGLGELADRAKALSRAQQWEQLPPLIDDETLHRFVTVGTYDQIGGLLHDRFGDIVTHCEFSVVVGDETDRAALAAMVADLHRSDDDLARATITG